MSSQPIAHGPASGRSGGRRFAWAGYLLGFALGGFFDGILLHQILQWHHLLSAVESDSFADLRVQILADGLFHALMYLIAIAGLWLLWQSRHELAAANASRLLTARLLIGFGCWHVVDTVFSHWLLQIHRIRMDAADPLAWDLLWLVLFGIIPVVAGVVLGRGGRRGGSLGGATTASILVALILSSGAVASLPPPAGTAVMVFFAPGTTAPEVFAAAHAAEARTIWSDRSGQLWAFDLADAGRAVTLYRHGALFVSGSFLPVGCLAWSRPI